VTKNKFSFLALLIANFFFFLNFSQLMLLPKFIAHLGLSPADIGLIMGTFSVSVLIVLPLVGFISEKIPKKMVFIFGAVLMCCATPLYAYAEDLSAFILILRIIQGVGFSCAFGITAAMVFDIVRVSQRRYLLGILTVFNISTHAIGPAFGEYVIRAYGFDYFFFSAAAFGVIACIAGFFLPAQRAIREKKPFSFRHALPYMVATVVLGIVFGTSVIFLPPYLMTLGITDSSFFFVAFVCGSLIVWAFLYKVLRRIGERIAWVITVILLLCLPAGVSWMNSILVLSILSLLFGMGYGYLYPTLNALFIDAYPRMRGMANSIFVWSFNFGMLLASLGFGSISDALGYSQAFFLSGLLGFALVFLTVKLKEG
jgi:MFS family permease